MDAFAPLRAGPVRRLLLSRRVDAGRWRRPCPERRLTWVTLGDPDHRLGTGAGYLVVRWWTFRWWIDEDAIWTSGGIFNEWRRRVTFGGVVTMDRSSTPVRRLFGVSRIALETTAVDQAAPDVLFGYLSNKNSTSSRSYWSRSSCSTAGRRGRDGSIAQRRSARVVGSDPCRSDDIPNRSRRSGPLRC